MLTIKANLKVHSVHLNKLDNQMPITLKTSALMR